MNKILSSTPHIVGGFGIWLTVNGILHDIFILASEHGKKYDRDLLRLLMDGHVLITCGVVLLLSFIPMKENSPFAYWVSLCMCLSILVYCFMIWPFLKSMVTLLFSLIAITLIIIKLKQI